MTEMHIYLQIPQFLLKFLIHGEIKSDGYRQHDDNLLYFHFYREEQAEE